MKHIKQVLHPVFQSGMVGANREGRAEGEARGRAEEKREIARKMKAAGRPSSEIAEFTGLPAENIDP